MGQLHKHEGLPLFLAVNTDCYHTNKPLGRGVGWSVGVGAVEEGDTFRLSWLSIDTEGAHDKNSVYTPPQTFVQESPNVERKSKLI